MGPEKIDIEEGEEKHVLLTGDDCPKCEIAKKALEERGGEVTEIDSSSELGERIAEAFDIKGVPEIISLKKQDGKVFACMDTDDPEKMRCAEVNPEMSSVAKIQIRNTMSAWKEQREGEIAKMKEEGVDPDWIEKYKKVVSEVDRAVEKIDDR